MLGKKKSRNAPFRQVSCIVLRKPMKQKKARSYSVASSPATDAQGGDKNEDLRKITPKKKTVVRAFLFGVLGMLPFLLLVTLMVPRVMVPVMLCIGATCYFLLAEDVALYEILDRRLTGELRAAGLEETPPQQGRAAKNAPPRSQPERGTVGGTDTVPAHAVAAAALALAPRGVTHRLVRLSRRSRGPDGTRVGMRRKYYLP